MSLFLGDIPAKPRFKGSFFSFEVTFNEDREKGYKDVLLVFSSGKREAVLRKLWFKLVHDQLSKDEFLLFITTLKDSNVKHWSFLKALVNFPKKILRERLVKVEKLLGEEESTRERYYGLKRISIEIHRIKRSLPISPKYTGYVRSIASLGKSKLRGSNFVDLITDETDEDENLVDWYNLLTVGELPLFQGGVMLTLNDDPKKDRNGTRNYKRDKRGRFMA